MQVHHGALLGVLAAMSVMLSGCYESKLKKHLISKHISPTAIENFINVSGENDKFMHMYCGKVQNYDMSNITENIWWPGCTEEEDFASEVTPENCTEKTCVKKRLLDEMDDFNKKYGGQRVTYKSRAAHPNGTKIEVVDLSGWWLPAPKATKNTPRIVIQHGFTSNSNQFREMFVAYQLRKLGFSVLVNNLRDHCYSKDSTSHLVGWGFAYPLDTLGAWDYAKDHAAEPISASKVGILGFSMGALTTNNAFGLEPEVPGIWVDGGPFTPQAGFQVGFKKSFDEVFKGYVSAGRVQRQAWHDIEQAALKKGVNLNEHLPEKLYPKGPDTKRQIFVSANKGDGTVAFSSSESLVNLVKKYPKKYTLVEFWEHTGVCGGKAHCVDHLVNPEEYEAKLCKFWSGVFKMADSTCGQETDDKNRLYEQESWVFQSLQSSSWVFVAAPALAAFLWLAVFVRQVRSFRKSYQICLEVDERDDVSDADA